MDENKLAEILEAFTTTAVCCSGEAQEYADELSMLLEEDESGDRNVVSYRDGGYLTNDAGFVLRVGNQEFQVTVARRR